MSTVESPVVAGERLKRLRLHAGYTQTELAQIAHLGLRSVQRYEADECAPQLTARRLIAQALGVHHTDIWPADA